MRTHTNQGVDQVWVNHSKCCHLTCESSPTHPPDLPPEWLASEVFLLLKDEDAEVRRNRKQRLILPSAVALAPTEATTRTMGTVTARPAAVPSQDPSEPKANNLLARTLVLPMFFKMVDADSPSLTVRLVTGTLPSSRPQC